MTPIAVTIDTHVGASSELLVCWACWLTKAVDLPVAREWTEEELETLPQQLGEPTIVCDVCGKLLAGPVHVDPLHCYRVFYRYANDDVEYASLWDATAPEEAALFAERAAAGHDDITIVRVEDLDARPAVTHG